MKKTILKITALSLFAAAIVAAPAIAFGQAATNATAVSEPMTAPAKKAKKNALLIFAGKVGTLDTNAMTLTVGKDTLDITSETKITKDGQPATLAEGMAGVTASGTYKKGADGKLSALTVNYTTKAAGTKKKKKLSADSTGSTTNSIIK